MITTCNDDICLSASDRQNEFIFIHVEIFILINLVTNFKSLGN